MTKTKLISSRKYPATWVTVSIVLPVVMLFLYMAIVNTFYKVDDLLKGLSVLVGLIVICMAIEVVAIVKLDRYKKLVPITALILFFTLGLLLTMYIIFGNNFTSY